MATARSSRPSGFLDFTVIGDDAGVQRMLHVLDTALSPIGISTFLGGSVGPWLKERAEDRFASEGDDVSGKWKPLAQSTQELRARSNWPVGPASPINVRTGELEDYITGSSAAVTPTAVGATLQYPGKTTSKKSIREKMTTAQRGKNKTPARPVLGVNERDLAYVITMLAFHVKGVGKRLGATP